MLRILYAGCLGLFPAISAQFTFTMCVAAEIAKNSLKLLILKVEGRLRSSIYVDGYKSLSSIVVVVSSMSVFTLDEPIAVK